MIALVTALTACHDGTGPHATPASIIKVAGDRQSGLESQVLAIPLVVQVNDSNYQPVAGVQVGFVVQTGGGSVSPAGATTGTNGQAEARWTLGPTLGAQTAIASVTNAGSVTFTASTPVPAKLAFTAQPTNATAGVVLSPAVAVTIEDSLGRPVPGAANAVSVALDTGLSGVSGTTTVTAVNGVATFGNLSIQRADGYFLTAFSDSLGRATSAHFVVTPAAPAQLIFTMQPSTSWPAQPIVPAVQVAIEDAFANLVLSATAAVTIAIGTNPSKGALSGTTTESAVGGVATFPNLAIDQPGSGYTLAATTPGLSGAASAAFTIKTPFTAVAVSAGGNNSCAVTTAGAAYCWGVNNVGQLGTGTTVGPQSCVAGFNPFTRPPRAFTLPCSSIPLAVSGGLTFAAVSIGDATCGVSPAGVASCWGFNGRGELGNGTTTSSPAPVAVSGGLTFAMLVATCGVTTMGSAYCWGDNTYGQLGDGTTTNSTVPVAVAGQLTFAAVSAGGSQTCGVTPAGLAYCWGDNNYGQLGNGTTTNSDAPVPVVGGLTFASISVGGRHSCGVTTSGAAYCWGYNGNGQLGNGESGDTAHSMVPVAVAGGLTFASISAGGAFHTCGLTTAGQAYCWGDNAAHELGNGTTINSTTPIAVAGGLTFAALSAGYGHTCGITPTDAVYCWGFNRFGQLGNGTSGFNSYSAVPVRVTQ